MRSQRTKKPPASYDDCESIEDYHAYMESKHGKRWQQRRITGESFEQQQIRSACYQRCLKNDSIKFHQQKKK